MLAKIAAFFKNFFRNAAADPVSTGKGVVQIAAAGATAYAMATGKLPANEMTTGFVTAATASGLHAIGSDNTAQAVADAGQQITATVEAIQTQAASVSALYQSIKNEVATAQSVITAASNGAADLAALTAIVPAAVTSPEIKR